MVSLGTWYVFFLFLSLQSYFTGIFLSKCASCQCKAVAAVVIGDRNINEVNHSWFETLHNREIDLMINGITHTLGREVREVSQSANLSGNLHSV